MTNKDIIEKQLEQFYIAIGNAKKEQLIIRNWCLTLIFALITVISTGKLELNDIQQILLLTTPILLFWTIESMQHSIVKINEFKARKLESIIVKSEIKSVNPELFYVTSLKTISIRQKLGFLFRSFFLTETIIIFYLLLIICVVLILMIFK